MSEARLANRVAVVTGAGRGLGRAVAVGFARQGAHVWICARTGPELERTGRAIRDAGATVEIRAADLADPEACRSFAAEVLRISKRVDVLVNNAGILRLTPVEQVTAAEWSQILAVNLTAPFLLTQLFLPVMKTGGGSVVNVSSRAGVMPFKNECAYCASKYGLEGLTRALALELEGTNVSLNTVTPGLRIKPTSLKEEDIDHVPAADREQWQDPERLVPAFVYLAMLRGAVSGLRFDAYKLSQLIEHEGFGVGLDRIKSIATESRPL